MQLQTWKWNLETYKKLGLTDIGTTHIPGLSLDRHITTMKNHSTTQNHHHHEHPVLVYFCWLNPYNQLEADTKPQFSQQTLSLPWMISINSNNAFSLCLNNNGKLSSFYVNLNSKKKIEIDWLNLEKCSC